MLQFSRHFGSSWLAPNCNILIIRLSRTINALWVLRNARDQRNGGFTIAKVDICLSWVRCSRCNQQGLRTQSRIYAAEIQGFGQWLRSRSTKAPAITQMSCFVIEICNFITHHAMLLFLIWRQKLRGKFFWRRCLGNWFRQCQDLNVYCSLCVVLAAIYWPTRTHLSGLYFSGKNCFFLTCLNTWTVERFWFLASSNPACYYERDLKHQFFRVSWFVLSVFLSLLVAILGRILWGVISAPAL